MAVIITRNILIGMFVGFYLKCFQRFFNILCSNKSSSKVCTITFYFDYIVTCTSNLIQTDALVNTCTFMAAAAVVFSCFMLMLSRRTFSYSLVKLVPWGHTCYLPYLSLFLMNGLALVSI